MRNCISQLHYNNQMAYPSLQSSVRLRIFLLRTCLDRLALKTTPARASPRDALSNQQYESTPFIIGPGGLAGSYRLAWCGMAVVIVGQRSAV